jgi:hypothetical protein
MKLYLLECKIGGYEFVIPRDIGGVATLLRDTLLGDRIFFANFVRIVVAPVACSKSVGFFVWF